VFVSRSLIGFLLFCVLLLAVSVVGVWYMGPTLAGIAVDTSATDGGSVGISSTYTPGVL